MAVYTDVAAEDLSAFLADYALGNLLSLKGIAEGVENSNYFVMTETGPFILTLYEKRVNADDLPFFLGLMEHLAERGVPCPTPIRDRNGVALKTLNGRPATLISFLTGVSPRRVTVDQCSEVGRSLAICTSKAPILRSNDPMRCLSKAGRRLRMVARNVPMRLSPDWPASLRPR